VLANAAATTFFTLAPLPFVLAETAATTVFAHAPQSLLDAEAAAAAVSLRVRAPLVFSACLQQQPPGHP